MATEGDDGGIGNFMDIFGNDGELLDTEALFDDMNASGHSNEEGIDYSDDDTDNDDEDTWRLAPRKQKFWSLEEVMDPQQYTSLPPEEQATFNWELRSRDYPKKYKWETVFNQHGRVAANNVLRNCPGPTRGAQRCTSVRELFDLFITENMLEHVRDYTNDKIDALVGEHPEWSNAYKSWAKKTTIDEIRAFYGLLYIRAVLRQNLLRVKRVFQFKYRNSLFSATMSRNRFEFLISLLQFDKNETRPERWENNRSAAFREFFNDFNQNCSKLCIPSEFLSIDETLYPLHRHISLKQYNPNKPAEYGLLYRSISDVQLPYTYNTLPHAGQPNIIIPELGYVSGTDNYTKYLVKGLEHAVDIRGWNISMDHYFTIMEVSC